jgi:lipid-A-disaccharide synthase
MGLINFLLVKMLVKVKYANIINIAANDEIIPELLQSNCNPEKIFLIVSEFLDDPERIKTQVKKTQLIINNLKTQKNSSVQVATALNKFLN